MLNQQTFGVETVPVSILRNPFVPGCGGGVAVLCIGQGRGSNASRGSTRIEKVAKVTAEVRDLALSLVVECRRAGALSTTYYVVTAMDKTKAENRVLQPDASGDANAVSAPVKTIDSARQLELDFLAPVLQMVLPDQETLEFWRATADNPPEVAGRIAKFSRRMQLCASASTRVTKNESKP
jgi:hypothetical protein